jgi:uncharacterized protein (DUF1697 family)
MHTYIALLRGINVGGSNLLPMADLKSLLADLGLQNVRTYIQSGNAVFESDDADAALIADRIGAAIRERRGFEPAVLVLAAEGLAQVVAANPFPEAEADPKALHLYFLTAVPAQPDLAALEALKADGEEFALQGRVFYLFAPAGIGRCKLAEKVERLLGVPATARNWRTVTQIIALAGGAA